MKDESLQSRIYRISGGVPRYIREVINSFRIVETDKVRTAATSIGKDPVLLISPAFVKEHCQSDAHLLMLILHECFHVILGHTRIFKDSNSVFDNIAFDAIINATLCKMFPSKSYVSFFTNLNPASSFPSCFLRPLADDTPKEFWYFMLRLYNDETTTYEDVYRFLLSKAPIPVSGDYVLIGEHPLKEPCAGVAELGEELEGIVLSGQGEGSDLLASVLSKVKTVAPEVSLLKKAESLLRKAGLILDEREMKKLPPIGETYVYEGKDRRAMVKREMSDLLLPHYSKEFPGSQKERLPCRKALVYLDVSGSMELAIPVLLPLFAGLIERKRCTLYQFSTKVAECDIEKMKEGCYEGTGGTDFNCIFKHYFSLKKAPKRVVIITDGRSHLSSSNLNKIRASGLQVYVGYFGSYIQTAALDRIAKCSVRLTQ